MVMSNIAHPENPPAATRPPVESISRPSPPPGLPVWAWLRRIVPTLLVVCTLAAIAYWGHSSEWTLPKFSSLFGNKQAVEDWCKEHNVPESQCIECNKALLPPAKDYGWCKEHGVAQCPLDHPDVAQFKVTPVVTAQELERAKRALALRPRAENNSRCTLHEQRIQFASLAGRRESRRRHRGRATQRPIVEAVIANGEVVYDQTHMAHLASRVAGTVWRVEKQVGDRVRKGDVLALIDAAEVGRAKAEFLQAIAQVRLKRANRRTAEAAGGRWQRARPQMREAEAALQEAKIRLLSAQQTLGQSRPAGRGRGLTPSSTPTKSPSGFNSWACRRELIAGFDAKLDDLESVSAAFAARRRGRRSQGRRRRSRRHDARCCSASPTCGGCG